MFAVVWEGKDVILSGRELLGATNPAASKPGTIRGDYAQDVGRNVCHGSDGPAGAEKEINVSSFLMPFHGHVCMVFFLLVLVQT